jgi:hypothetical protein
LPTTKIHWNLFFFVFLIVLLAAWTTTQWTAWCSGFQSELAPSRFEAPGVFTFYFPLIFFGGGTLSEITDPRFSSHAAQATVICNADDPKSDLMRQEASESDIIVRCKMKEC